MNFKEMHMATQSTAEQAGTTVRENDLRPLIPMPKFLTMFNAAYNFVNRVKVDFSVRTSLRLSHPVEQNFLPLQPRNGDVRLYYFIHAIEAYENRQISIEDLHHDMRKIFAIYPKFLIDFERFLADSPHYAFHDGTARSNALIYDLGLNSMATQHSPALSSASQQSLTRARRSTPASSGYGRLPAPVRQRPDSSHVSLQRPQYRPLRPVKKPDTWYAKSLAQSLRRQRQSFGAPSPKLKVEKTSLLTQASPTAKDTNPATMGGLPIVPFLPSQRIPRSHSAPSLPTALADMTAPDPKSTPVSPAPFNTFVAATPAEISTPPANTGTGQGPYKCPLCDASFSARHTVRYHFYGRSNVKNMKVGKRGFPHMNSAGCFNRKGQPEGVEW